MDTPTANVVATAFAAPRTEPASVSSVRSQLVATLEIRRHSLRKNTGGSQLSQAGVELARKLGDSMGPFAVVATSVVPRARETALAMGFAVDQEMVTLAALWRDLLTPLAEQDAALVIGHSGELESALVACFPDADHAAWGGPFNPCEGARLTFTNRFTTVEFLRVW